MAENANSILKFMKKSKKAEMEKSRECMFNLKIHAKKRQKCIFIFEIHTKKSKTEEKKAHLFAFFSLLYPLCICLHIKV